MDSLSPFDSSTTSAAAYDGSQAQESNNDRVMAIQRFGGVRKDTGEVTFTYYGNMAFKITSPRGVEVFVDPWRNDVTGMYPYWFVMQMPKVTADVALITHSHFDHDAMDRLDTSMILDRMAGEYTLGDVKKLDGKMWMIQARIQYRDSEAVMVPLPLPVEWAGDTPVIVVDNFTIPGMGTFSARVMFFDDHYAGYWKHGDRGGNLFGVVHRAGANGVARP